MNMKLIVGSRGNLNSTRAIIEGTGGKIDEVYLSVKNSRFGSGRNYVHEVDISEIARQVEIARKHKVHISPAFNTVCFGAQKFNDSFRNEFTNLIGDLREVGIDRLIISDPYIMEIVRDKFPDMKIIVSVFSEVDSINRLKFYNDMGVDRIVIPHELNRNMEKLKKFVEVSKCDLELLLNLGCSHYCARGDTHSMFTGHYVGEMRKKVMGDCYNAYCNRYKLNHPSDFLSQDWIRPEDIYRYEKIGIEYFKIAGRATSTSRVIKTANAYIDRSYEGNIFDLISTYYPFTDRVEEQRNPNSNSKTGNPLYIPNKKLDEIMDILYKCGHICDECNKCKSLFNSLIS